MYGLLRNSVIVGVGGLAVLAGSARASVLASEPFNYGSASTLAGQSGASGTTGSYVRWTNGSAANTLGDYGLVSTSLAYPAGTITSSGGSASNAPSTLNVGDYIALATAIDLSNTGIARSYYISFLEQRFWTSTSAPTSSAFFGVDFSSTPAASPRTAAVDITFGAGSSGTFRTGGDPQNGSSLANTVVAGSVSGNAVLTTIGSTKFTDTYFILGRIDIDATGVVTTHIKSYADATTSTLPTADPATWDANATLAAFGSSYGYLQVRRGTNIGQNVDEILVGTTLADVTPAPGTAMLGAVGVLALGTRRRRS